MHPDSPNGSRFATAPFTAPATSMGRGPRLPVSRHVICAALLLNMRMPVMLTAGFPTLLATKSWRWKPAAPLNLRKVSCRRGGAGEDAGQGKARHVTSSQGARASLPCMSACLLRCTFMPCQQCTRTTAAAAVGIVEQPSSSLLFFLLLTEYSTSLV